MTDTPKGGDQFASKVDFFNEMLTVLGRRLDDTVGPEDAAGLVSIVAGEMGDALNEVLVEENGGMRLTRAQVARALVELKARIGGNFRIEDESENGIVLSNTACPFGCRVNGVRALCMMTSGVFGRIAAENLGYARVRLDKTLANGDGKCCVTVELGPDAEGDGPGIAYFGRTG
ncbi:MAG: methanogen output domain 1-containing protein [Paracoccaceae bacterium]